MRKFAFLLASVTLLYAPGCGPGTPPSTTISDAHTSAVQPAAESQWTVDHEVNAVTGVQTTVAYLKLPGEQNFYVRQIGKKLECYITTDEFLETVDNMDSRISPVQYKIDNGQVTRQGWLIGASNEDLFYPGNCAPFVEKLRIAKSIAFEFHPADKVPENLVFDISGFPNEFKPTAPAPGESRARRQRNVEGPEKTN